MCKTCVASLLEKHKFWMEDNLDTKMCSYYIFMASPVWDDTITPHQHGTMLPVAPQNVIMIYYCNNIIICN